MGVGSGRGGVSGWGGQGRCEQRSEVFVKIKRKYVCLLLLFFGGVRSGGGEVSQDGCEQRIEVFVKIPKKNFFLGGGGGGGGVRGCFGLGAKVEENEELKFL